MHSHVTKAIYQNVEIVILLKDSYSCLVLHGIRFDWVLICVMCILAIITPWALLVCTTNSKIVRTVSVFYIFVWFVFGLKLPRVPQKYHIWFDCGAQVKKKTSTKSAFRKFHFQLPSHSSTIISYSIQKFMLNMYIADGMSTMHKYYEFNSIFCGWA